MDHRSSRSLHTGCVSLYHSPRGLFPHQLEQIPYAAARPVNYVRWDTGIGKTHIGMATGALLYEDEEISRIVVIAERAKVDRSEWPKDFADFTDLTVGIYHGDPKKRAKLRDNPPQVLISTYETIRTDATKTIDVVVKGQPKKKQVPGAFTEFLLDADKPPLLVYDEITPKLGNRGSGTYKAHEIMLKALRKKWPDVRIMALTACKIQTSPENFFNVCRLISPAHAGTVEQFYEHHVAARDIFGEPSKFKNLGREDHYDLGVRTMSEKLAPIMLDKRKTDPDVAPFFPKQIEEFTHVSLGDQHRAFYKEVKDFFADADPWTQRAVYVALRQIAGHPMSLLRSQGKVAQALVDAVGPAGLKAMGCAKADRFIEYLKPLVNGQGAQVVAFTFFGQSILPILAERLQDEKLSFVVNHGQMSDEARAQAKNRFKAGEVGIFLSSDAGSRGLNFGNASYVCNYEAPITHANYIQRINRVHRIDSSHVSVTCQTLIVLDSIEEGVIELGYKRNAWEDRLLPDEDDGGEFLTAEDRKRLINFSKKVAKAA